MTPTALAPQTLATRARRTARPAVVAIPSIASRYARLAGVSGTEERFARSHLQRLIAGASATESAQ